MKRCLFILYALVAIAQIGHSQGFDYDIWLDSRRDAMIHGKFTPGENTLTLDMSVIKTGGLHFLNVIPYYEWGEMGQWSCIPFIVPEGWPHTTNASFLEYWVYGYDSKPTRIPYDGTTYTLNIDLSKMSYGIHFLNVRCFNDVGEAGPWKQIAFYLSNFVFDKEPLCYQYWIDNGEAQTCHDYYPGMVTLPISLENISIGKHTFSYRVCYSEDPNAEGAEFGATTTVNFEVPAFINIKEVNNDGTLNVEDIIAITNFIAGKGGDVTSEKADVNSDGAVNVADITTVSNFIAGGTGVINLINNSSMEGDDVSSFFVKVHGGDITPAVITDGVGVNGSRGIKVEATTRENEDYDNQFWFRLNQPVSAGTKIRVSFDYRADKIANVRSEAHGEPSDYIDYARFFGDKSFTPEWQHFSYEGTVASANSTVEKPLRSIAFSLSLLEETNNYYFDNITFEVITGN